MRLRSQTDGPIFYFKDFLVKCRIHSSISYVKLSRSRSCKAAPEHHSTTTMFNCWYNVFKIKYCVPFMTDAMGRTPSEEINFCLISITLFLISSWKFYRFCFAFFKLWWSKKLIWSVTKKINQKGGKYIFMELYNS